MKRVILALVMAAACTPIKGHEGPRLATGAGEPGAFDYCAGMSREAGQRGSQLAMAGWVFGIGATGATAGATIIPLTDEGGLSTEQKVATLSLVAVAAAFGVVSKAYLARSDSASALSGATASVLGEMKDGARIDPHLARAKCNVAYGAWQQSRTDASTFATLLHVGEKESEAEAARSGPAPAQDSAPAAAPGSAPAPDSSAAPTAGRASGDGDGPGSAAIPPAPSL